MKSLACANPSKKSPVRQARRVVWTAHRFRHALPRTCRSLRIRGKGSNHARPFLSRGFCFSRICRCPAHSFRALVVSDVVPHGHPWPVDWRIRYRRMERRQLPGSSHEQPFSVIARVSPGATDAIFESLHDNWVWIAICVVLLIALFFIAEYLSSVSRFVLLESVITGKCELRQGWRNGERKVCNTLPGM